MPILGRLDRHLATFKFSAAFTSQDASNNRTGTLTGTLPSDTEGGQSFTVPFSSGIVSGNDVTINGSLPANTPPIPIGASCPMAGRKFQYNGTVSGSTMGGTGSSFSFQLTASESSLAALFGVQLQQSPTAGYFVFGTASMTKVTGTTGGATGGITVPIQ